MYVSISMKSYLIWKKTLKLTQIKIRAAKIKVVGPIDVEYSIFKKVLGTSAEVFSFQFMPIRTIFGCQFIFFFLPKITTRVYFHQWLDLLIQVPEEVRKGLMILKSVNLNHRKLSEKVNFRIFFLLVFGSCCKRDD